MPDWAWGSISVYRLDLGFYLDSLIKQTYKLVFANDDTDCSTDEMVAEREPAAVTGVFDLPRVEESP